jgi:hypothetical protein
MFLTALMGEVVEGERAISNLVVRFARYVAEIRQMSLCMLKRLQACGSGECDLFHTGQKSFGSYVKVTRR